MKRNKIDWNTVKVVLEIAGYSAEMLWWIVLILMVTRGFFAIILYSVWDTYFKDIFGFELSFWTIFIGWTFVSILSNFRMTNFLNSLK
ncbi:MAG: hypothetical protein RI973_1136 [Bacteroidota bacterium]